MNGTDSNGGFEAFAAHAGGVAARFERRRMQFLHQLKWRCAIAGALLLTFPLWYSLMESLDNVGSGALSSLSWVLIHGIAGAVIVVCVIAWGMMPLFRYRHYTAQIGTTLPGVSGVVQQHVSLKGEIFGQLLSYFGNFALHDDRKLSLKIFHHAPGMPDFDDFTSEDYIQGAIEGIGVEITEAELSAWRHRASEPLFAGLMIVLDINDTNRVLHGTFSGKTVVIEATVGDHGKKMVRYAGYQSVALPDKDMAKRFEVFTTNGEEAGRLLSPDLLRGLMRVSAAVQGARNQVRHIDDRIAYAITGVATGLSDAIALLAAGAVNWFKTGSLRTLPTRLEMQSSAPVAAPDAQGWNVAVHCAFYDDKVLIAIPCHHNLFEPDMIFRPPLHEADIRLIYEMMDSIGGMARAVVGALPKGA